MYQIVRRMFWEIIKTALLSLLVIYLSHQIYLSFFKKTRVIPRPLSNENVNNEYQSHTIKPIRNENIPSLEQDKDSTEKGSENDMKSELMDFLNNTENNSSLNETTLGVTSLSDLPDKEKQ